MPRRLAALLVLALALRLPLWTLPGLGRDEAMYLLWSHHPEPAYAPLLQLLLAALRALGADAADPWLLRLPSVLAGLAAVALFDHWLRRDGHRGRGLLVALLLFVLSPWQTYAGAILHPDDLQLVAILGFAAAARSGRVGLAMLAAALAPWTKTSGILVTLVAVVWCRSGPVPQPRRRLLVGATLLVAAVPFVFLRADLLRAMMSFGSAGADTSLLTRLTVLIGSVAFLAGPGALAAVLAARRRRPALDVVARPDRVLAVLLLAAFGAALVVTGQVKGNWVLPGLFLLWPAPSHAWLTRSRTAGTVAVATSLALSLALGWAFSRPEQARRADEAWGERVLPGYLRVAGEREREVATAQRWWHRVAEYRDPSPWFATFAPDAPTPPVVVSDDYGLAAQWAVRCPSPVPRVVLPLDPLTPVVDRLPAGTLVIAVQRPVEALVGPEGWTALGARPHPVTGAPVQRARTDRALELPPRERTP